MGQLVWKNPYLVKHPFKERADGAIRAKQNGQPGIAGWPLF
jgi:hypothetical protein